MFELRSNHALERSVTALSERAAGARTIIARSTRTLGSVMRTLTPKLSRQILEWD